MIWPSLRLEWGVGSLVDFFLQQILNPSRI
jgi:hypothetical protein